MDEGEGRQNGEGDAGSDVSSPEQIARTTTEQGSKKASLDLPVLVVLGLLAGAYIAFGGLFSAVAQAGA